MLRTALDSAVEHVSLQLRRCADLPRYGSFSNLPPMMIHVGTAEILRDDALAVGNAATVGGSKVEVHVWEGMAHVFPLNLASLNAARKAVELSAGFLDEQSASLHNRA